jgi:hypothetical protein
MAAQAQVEAVAQETPVEFLVQQTQAVEEAVLVVTTVQQALAAPAALAS